ncbi:MAG TPA: UDP-N-acetylglucosamine 1-carboxyvinyltransferase [Alphaproteobacteria bacterium]|nr:UDP-N-acetylglucosamine 1-carboxyvinyltransferase [Alphaproteobacteria bacterium]
MDRIAIVGGKRLNGRIPIGGAKNAALPLMVASLLSEAPLKLSNVPNLADIGSLKTILAQHGAAIDEQGHSLSLQAKFITSTTAPYDLVRKMRASFLVIGPLLARCGDATVSLPGGCAIGTRPVDLHLMGLEKLGAKIALEDGYVHAKAHNGLKGADIEFPFVSVGATENLIMAACLAKGTTRLLNAALEPEITDLATCLAKMGAKISGVGTRTLTIDGVAALGGATHAVIPDRIETGTYLMAAAMAGGEVVLEHTEPRHCAAAIEVLRAAGADVETRGSEIAIRRNGRRLKAVDVTTEPFPGFPTDLQAQLMALMTLAEGQSHIRERIFENRFMHVPELARMGAKIAVEGDHATVTGVDALQGAPVMATDLRASVSLVIAGLAAEGQTIINRVYHLDRGFERLEEKLSLCGADIHRLKE